VSEFIIGSHVSMSGKKMLVGAVEQAVEYGANALMIYTGAPQNTIRRPISDMNIEAGHKLMAEHNIPLDNLIIHAPYIINLGNAVKPSTFELAVDFLRIEIGRVEALGAKYVVLHPGAHVGEGTEVGIAKIIEGLNEVLTKSQTAIICLETMSGKGSECGITFEEISEIIEGVHFKDKLGVCLDTCHIHDAGYVLEGHVDAVLDDFDKVVGLEYLKVIHLNDSKNPVGAHKDRHENIGYGHIG